MHDHRDVEAVGEDRRLADLGPVGLLGGDAQEWRRIAAFEPRPPGTVELLVHGRAIGGDTGEIREERGVDLDVAQHAVTVVGLPGERVGAQRVGESSEAIDDIATERRASRVALAHEAERVAHRPVEVAIPRVLIFDRVGGVERERADPIGMTDGEGLAEERAVRVAVQVDAIDPQCVEHGGEVIGGQRGAVEVGRGAELLAAQPDVLEVVALQRLEPRAVDERRRARAASIDEQDIATGEQRREQVEVVVARIGGRVAGTTLDGDDGAERGLVAVVGAVELEADRDRGTVGNARVERPLDRPAPGVRHIGAPAQKRGPLAWCLRLVGGLGSDGRRGRADDDRHHEGDTAVHLRDRNIGFTAQATWTSSRAWRCSTVHDVDRPGERGGQIGPVGDGLGVGAARPGDLGEVGRR